VKSKECNVYKRSDRSEEVVVNGGGVSGERDLSISDDDEIWQYGLKVRGSNT
jgi:hypothetical protein